MKNIYIKLIAILLALVCLLCSCQKEDDDSSKPEKTDKPSSYETEDPDEDEEEEEEPEDTSGKKRPVVLVGDQAENENYKQITPRDISSYKFVSFLTDSSQEILCLKVPSDWGVTKVSKSSYSISRDGKEIGQLFLGESSDYNQWQTVAEEETDLNNFDMTECIEKFGQGETLKFRYRYFAKSKLAKDDLYVTLTVDYAELNSKAAYNIFKVSSFESRKDFLNVGTVSEAKDGNILIIGNSFIGTSNIGSILREMISRNGKSTDVNAISRGMATVETYVTDSSLMREIENGVYDAVFMCGLYSPNELENLKILKEKCEASDTKLVIFPAHNEDSATAAKAAKRNPSLVFLNWQQEIEYLIKDGRDKWDFCTDDTYDHSTALAGYVGAHMIYRAIYGELPSASARLNSSISQTDVNRVLGDYVTTGCARGALYTLK